MSTPPADRHPLDPHLAGLADDITTITDDLRWAYADAWWPTVTDPLQPSRRSTSPELDEHDQPADPDHVPGKKYALGIGDDTTRQALEDVTDRLRQIEIRVAASVFLAGTRDHQPALVQPEHHANLATLERTINGIRWRLDALHEDAPRLNHQDRAAVRHQLRHARRAADRARRRLTDALSRGETGGHAHAEPKCRICGIRPRAQRERTITAPNGARRTEARPTKGGRCDTCAQWYTRNGSERPRDLDSATVDDALAAAGRRRARGEGWGSA